MFDIALRPAKDALIDPLIRFIPASIHPHHITAIAFLCGLFSCLSACTGFVALSVIFWALNRLLDCLDGAVARHRKQQSELGGFLDLLGDFIVYALTPLSVVCGNHVRGHTAYELTASHLAITALLEASFFLNNFVLFYIAALIERKNVEGLHKEKEEITSLAMRPALIEGFESGVFFTVMLAIPSLVGPVACLMFVGVALGTWQRSRWLIIALGRKKSD
jgi:phosphatidylglycerophosphate synthase